jgi:hypothetical protein
MTMPGMQEAMGRDVPRMTGEVYAATAEEWLAQALGRPPEVGEVADFVEIASSTLLGGMYDIMRRSKGPEKAEAWLKRTFSLMCSHVRRRGSDAFIKVDVSIKDAPNRLAKMRPEAVQEQYAQAIAPPPTCGCALDAEGRCATCAGRLSAYFQSVFAPFREMAAAAGKEMSEICRVCQPGQADYAMSKAVGEARKHGDDMLLICYQLAAGMGAREMPLTEKAWQEATAAPAPQGP